MRFIQWGLCVFLSLGAFLTPHTAIADDYPVFDGRTYNGKFYPRIDVIEWGEPSHMEFHIYSKDKPLDLSFQVEKKDGRTVLLVNYYLKDRDEHLCRRVVAPGHFFEGGYKVYKDMSDSEFDNVVVAMDELPTQPAGLQKVRAPAYASCDQPAPATKSTVAQEKSVKGPKNYRVPKSVGDGRTKSKSGAITKEDGSAPFSDL